MSSIWNCCFSCCKENKETQNDDATERTRLLSDPTHNIASIQRVADDYFGGNEASTPMSDEQAAKRKVFQEGAADMIDVTGPYQIDQHEYKERMNEYSRRLALSNIRLPPTKPKFILEDIADPEVYLSSTDIISDIDYRLILNVSRDFAECLNEIKVEHKDDVVVPFEIPWPPA